MCSCRTFFVNLETEISTADRTRWFKIYGGCDGEGLSIEGVKKRKLEDKTNFGQLERESPVVNENYDHYVTEEHSQLTQDIKNVKSPIESLQEIEADVFRDNVFYPGPQGFVILMSDQCLQQRTSENRLLLPDLNSFSTVFRKEDLSQNHISLDQSLDFDDLSACVQTNDSSSEKYSKYKASPLSSCSSSSSKKFISESEPRYCSVNEDPKQESMVY